MKKTIIKQNLKEGSKIRRRGQGATEYIIMLAIVIIIALVVVSLLGWFPGVGLGVTEQQSKAYWSSASPFIVKEFKATSSGVTFTLQNSTTGKLQLTEITVDNVALGLADANYSAGQTAATTEDNSVTCTTGEPVQYDVIITYDTDYITGMKQTGAKPLVTTCG